MATLPNLLVIGAMKCATSALHYHLGLHPEIAMSGRKELNFFLPEEPTPAAGGEAELALLAEPSTASRGLGWYGRQFAAAAAVRGESSVAYTFPWFPGVADRAATTLGDVKLVYLVRDPIERLVSHHAQLGGRDRRPLAEAVAAPGNPYLEASRYATALQPFVEAFGRQRLLIVDSDRLRAEPETSLREVLEFVGVDPGLQPAGGIDERNVSGRKGRAYRAAERLRSTRTGSALAGRVPARLRRATERALGAGSPPSGGERLGPEQAAQARRVLEPEIAGLERLTGWDLGRWREQGPTGVPTARVS